MWMEMRKEYKKNKIKQENRPILPKLVVYNFEGTPWIDSGSRTNSRPRLMDRRTYVLCMKESMTRTFFVLMQIKMDL